MTADQFLIFTILGLTVFFFIWDRWRYDLVAIISLGAAVLAGVVPYDKAFSGFTEPVVTTVAMILVISAAIGQSGFVDLIMGFLSRYIKWQYMQILVLILLVMVLSTFMNNIGALAIVLPVAISMARKNSRNPSEILMSLSFASLLGGLVSLIGTPPNLLISDLREKYVGQPYEMFDFSPVGIGLCLISLLYLSFAPKILPKERKGTARPEDSFEIADYISEVMIDENSSILDKNVGDVETMFGDEIEIIGITRTGDYIPAPSLRRKIKTGDILILRSDTVALKRFVDEAKVSLTGNKAEAITSDEVGVSEAIVLTGAQITDMTVRELKLRQRFGVHLLAVRQNGRRKAQRLRDVRFKEGDVIVLQGNLDVISETLKELGCLPLAERNLLLGRPRRMFMPPLLMFLAVLSTVTDLVPVHIAFAGAVLTIAATKTLRMDEIYQAVNWPIIVLLGSLLPVTEALQTTGGDKYIVDHLLPLLQDLSPRMLLTAVLVATMAVTPFLNNAAAVLLMGPIAAGLAMGMGVSVDPFLMAVAVGASCDFLTPIGHQSNTLVLGPGGYKFTDYFRLGFPLTLIVIVAGVPLIMWAWPFTH